MQPLKKSKKMSNTVNSYFNSKQIGNLIYFSTKNMSEDDWLRFRKRGIGASEFGAVMGLSPYKSNVELFWEKVGQGLNYSIESMAMFSGTEMEDFVARWWEYWGGDEASLIRNKRMKNKVRKMSNVNAYIQNITMPHLFISLDRRIHKHVDIDTGEQRQNGALEIKTISGFESDKWESGIPPSHVAQIQGQLLVTGWKYGELAVLKDGRKFDVYPFERHAGMCKAILKKTTDFWKRVESARGLLTKQYEAEKNFNTKKFNELEAELQRIEPAPDASDGLANFLKEKYKNPEPKSERPGTLIELETAKKHLELKNQQKGISEQLQLCENTLKSSMRNIESISWPGEGFVSWKSDSNNARRFLNKVIIQK